MRLSVIFFSILINTGGQAALTFNPDPQFEGGTVTTECDVKISAGLWTFDKVVAMEFLLGDKDRKLTNPQMLAKHTFATGKTLKRADTKRNFTIKLDLNSGPRTSKMTVKLHDVRCRDSVNPSYCRLTVVQKGKNLYLTNPGRINVFPKPAKPFLKTASNEKGYIELAENRLYQFECLSNGSDKLQMHWLKYPYGSSTATLLLNDIQAQQMTIQDPRSCRNVRYIDYHGVYMISAKREDDFSMFQCVMYYEAKKYVVDRSEKIFLFVTPEPVLSKTVVQLASGIQLKNGSAYRYDAVAYEGQTLQISCSPSVAEISSVGVTEILRLRLSVFHHGKDEVEIKTVIPPVPSYNKKSNLSIHSESEVELLEANDTATGVATLLWTIHEAECAGQDYYKCTVWYQKNDRSGATRPIEVKATHQRIDFQCGVHPVQIMGYTYNGTAVPPKKAKMGQDLIMNCIFWGPRSILWNITGHGYSIYVGNSTLEDTVRGVHQKLRGEKCYCFRHDKNFSVQVPIVGSHENTHVAQCHASIPGVAGRQSLFYFIKRNNEDDGSLLLFILKILGAAFLIIACAAALFKATDGCPGPSSTSSSGSDDSRNVHSDRTRGLDNRRRSFKSSHLDVSRRSDTSRRSDESRRSDLSRRSGESRPSYESRRSDATRHSYSYESRRSDATRRSDESHRPGVGRHSIRINRSIMDL